MIIELKREEILKILECQDLAETKEYTGTIKMWKHLFEMYPETRDYVWHLSGSSTLEITDEKISERNGLIVEDNDHGPVLASGIDLTDEVLAWLDANTPYGAVMLTRKFGVYAALTVTKDIKLAIYDYADKPAPDLNPTYKRSEGEARYKPQGETVGRYPIPIEILKKFTASSKARYLFWEELYKLYPELNSGLELKLIYQNVEEAYLEIEND